VDQLRKNWPQVNSATESRRNMKLKHAKVMRKQTVTVYNSTALQTILLCYS